MTKKETIYNALGMIEGAVCVSQKNTREVLMKAIDMIKEAIEEDTNEENIGHKNDCEHEWKVKAIYDEQICDAFEKPRRHYKYVCAYCGETKFGIY